MSVQKEKRINRIESDLLPIPDKLYFTIGEVSILCKLKPHVLRYWEQEFNQLAPTKRRGRRYYQKKDVLLIRKIRDLLYDQGFTIEGARQQLTHPIYPSSLHKAITTLEKIVLELEAV